MLIDMITNINLNRMPESLHAVKYEEVISTSITLRHFYLEILA